MRGCSGGGSFRIGVESSGSADGLALRVQSPYGPLAASNRAGGFTWPPSCERASPMPSVGVDWISISPSQQARWVRMTGLCGVARRCFNRAIQTLGDALMGELVSLQKHKKALRRQRAKGATLCGHGHHRWVRMDADPFDVRTGRLVTRWRCSRCGAEKNAAT